jgi:DNA-directed RNA polymerase specialized sigma24 family protein
MNEPQGGSPIATGERLEFAHELFDRHADEMYHYVLAWTGEQATAVDLTTTVLRTAVGRMDQLVEGADADELEMRLMALLRAAVIKRQARQSGKPQAATAVPEEFMALFEGLGRLDDTEREVLVLCDLLGQEPDRVARLLGCDREVLDELRGAGAESLWRAMNDAPEDQTVSTWQRLTVGAALRQAAAGWLHPADGSVLAYVSEQLFGEAPVGVPASVPPRHEPTKPDSVAKPDSAAPAGPPGATPPPGKAPALPVRPGGRPVPATAVPAAKDGKKVPPEMSPAAVAKANAKLGGPAAAAAAAAKGGTTSQAGTQAQAGAKSQAAPKGQPAPKGRPGTGTKVQTKATGNGQAKGNGAATAGAAAAAAEQGAQRAKAATTGEQPREQKTLSGALAALAGLRGRWAAWGIAAAAAAILGVVAALTIGGPVSGSSDCPNTLSCLPSTTLAAGGRNTLPPGSPPTDAAGNLMPTSSLAGGGFVPAPGFPLITGTSVTTTTGGRVPTTTQRGTATTAKPPGTTRPPGSTASPTTAGPTTTEDTTPPTTEQPTTTDTTTPNPAAP